MFYLILASITKFFGVMLGYNFNQFMSFSFITNLMSSIGSEFSKIPIASSSGILGLPSVLANIGLMIFDILLFVISIILYIVTIILSIIESPVEFLPTTLQVALIPIFTIIILFSFIASIKVVSSSIGGGDD